MNTLLHINSSLFSDQGQSSQLAAQYVADWKAANPRGHVISRDLARDPVPHLTAERFQAFLADPARRSAEQAAHVAYSDALVQELRAADTIVLALPMYNFGVPSALKAYFDHIARSGVTFRYTEKGPVGLMTGKRAVVIATRGGLYAGTPLDTQTGYVRDFLRFIGIGDVQFIRAEGVGISAEQRAASLAAAHAQIQGAALAEAA